VISPVIDQDKLHMKFLALNVDFNGPSLDHECIKEGYPYKTRYFTPVDLFSERSVALSIASVNK